MPPLPGKAISRQLPFRKDDGLFADDFIEERRQGLEQFINKFVSTNMFVCCCIYGTCMCYFVFTVFRQTLLYIYCLSKGVPYIYVCII